jgi:hydroxymethylbilane synthase
MNSSSIPLRIGTRGSPLALAQAEETRRRLEEAWPQLKGGIEICVIHTTGDQIQDRTLALIGGKGLFTKEIDDAQLADRVDIAVHSMKDVPTLLPAGLTLAALLPREDVRDALISTKAKSLAELPQGAVVGTASLRRGAQILRRRPDLKVIPFRGNVQTRLRKLSEGQVDATLLAMAGLHRLGLHLPEANPLDIEEVLPAVAQGAIGITCRAGDQRAVDMLAALDHGATRSEVEAERAFLGVLDGSCRTPIAGLARVQGVELGFTGMILLPDGSVAHDVAAKGAATDAGVVGHDAGQDLLTRAGRDFLAGAE